MFEFSVAGATCFLLLFWSLAKFSLGGVALASLAAGTENRTIAVRGDSSSSSYTLLTVFMSSISAVTYAGFRRSMLTVQVFPRTRT